MNPAPHIAIAGATGAVGVEMLRCLEQRNFPVGKLTLLASARSVGKKMTFRGQEIALQELTKDSFAGVDIALFSAGGGISKEFAPAAVAAGAVVVDNSSAYRGDADVPLIVPEINAAAAKQHKGILANPNCSTAITLMALYPLHQAFGVKRVIASTYQAVSGTGAQAIEELAQQSREWAAQDRAWDAAKLDSQPKVYPYQIAFNVLPQVDSFLDSGYTKEEMKMENEGRKIMSHPSFQASVTCVRVPVFRAHSIAVTAQFENPVDLAAAKAALAAAPGLDLIDDPANRQYPLPLDIAGRENCAVGRLRLDCALENALSFWVVGDQLLKGAALNAVQIAELLV
jgi:aspartate-semialdehyde dehydrogenase